MAFNPSDYTVNANGIIQDPGKFEAEPLYVPYFYDLMLDGSESETIYDGETPVAVFVVDDEDRAKFETLADVYAVVIWESDQGFCNAREMSETDLENFRTDCEESQEDTPQEDDITTEDHERFYQSGRLVLEHAGSLRGDRPDQWFWYDAKVCRFLGRFGDDHKAALRKYMELSKFWPNAWFISDHGNAHLIDLTEDK